MKGREQMGQRNQVFKDHLDDPENNPEFDKLVRMIMRDYGYSEQAAEKWVRGQLRSRRSASNTRPAGSEDIPGRPVEQKTKPSRTQFADRRIEELTRKGNA